MLDHSCFEQDSGMPTKLPTRVIDVGNSSRDPHLYITHGETGRFATLSHRGPPQMSFKRLTTTQNNLSEHCERIELDKLPRTFRDAINITRELGLQYIWIDSLCIVQDSPEDWTFEVSYMTDVYRNAYVTLAADMAHNSDAGLFVTETCATNGAPQVRQFSQVDDTGICQILVRLNWPKPGKNRHLGDVENSRSCYASEAVSKLKGWAWALQENMLSTRTVHFTNAELIWECGYSYECSCGNPMYRNSTMSDFKVILKSSSTARFHSEETSNLASGIWHSVVEDFTYRDLTYEKDRLPALSSLARMLPFSQVEYLAGLWQNRLADDLIWLNPLGRTYSDLDDNSAASARPDTPKLPNGYRIQGEYAPSWSWASISALVAFKIGDLDDVIPEWRITGATCTPITTNLYGPVSKSSSLNVEGYILPVSFSSVTSTTSIGQNGNCQAPMKVWVMRGDEAFPGRNKTWFDAGAAAQEWRVEGYAYYVLVIGCRKADDIPLALILREAGSVDGEVYTRIGIVSLENWKGHEWNAGVQQRAITIF
ncbi:hypothetical protein VE02_04233 [Pseudogymnoascus sp. 03VT05]|nr:hypothetical protein VE02_04233 [Pseudogymnoascus sp. 03VT05]